MKRNSLSLLLILFGIVMILKTSFEIYENRPGRLNENEINAMVSPKLTNSNVYSLMNDGDTEIVKTYLRKLN